MEQSVFEGAGKRWLAEECVGEPQAINKPTEETRAWFAVIGDHAAFVKWYPAALTKTWVKTEAAIAGSSFHPAIVPLRQRIDCADRTLLVYDRVSGENLGPQEVRARFQRLPVAERAWAVLAASEALAAVCDAGFVVVDWYEGNMIYDFDRRRLWLFDWELCRSGGSFILEMDSTTGRHV